MHLPACQSQHDQGEVLGTNYFFGMYPTKTWTNFDPTSTFFRQSSVCTYPLCMLVELSTTKGKYWPLNYLFGMCPTKTWTNFDPTSTFYCQSSACTYSLSMLVELSTTKGKYWPLMYLLACTRRKLGRISTLLRHFTVNLQGVSTHFACWLSSARPKRSIGH